MKKTTLTMITAFLGAALAVPVGAQNDSSENQGAGVRHPARAQKATRLAAGEAANLQKSESGQASEDAAASSDMQDNRGGLSSAGNAPLQPQQISKAQPARRSAAAHVSHVSQQHHTAELKTGALTTGQPAHLETRETALNREIHSDREQDGRLTPQDQSDKNNSEIHLKKYNARMF